ncbi:DUF6114 domain-containing protein [Streptomyces corynorhini]|uniref:DUF6114 domain-containing protein n=1 Tax=Streptomyces corynorhini TaxID=2282652 RepID=UPI001F390D6C|nr:DUF6114 domain-containing protein [Streptomyces corynorhini]
MGSAGSRGPAGTAVPARAARRPPRAFARWRARRPFWGGLLLLLGGGEILLTEQASISVVLQAGAGGIAAYLLPLVMAVCGLLLILNPAQRLFYSVVGVLVSLGTWITSNLGGFFVGLLLGVLGSSLAFGWLPDQEPRRRWRRAPRADPVPVAPAAPVAPADRDDPADPAG